MLYPLCFPMDKCCPIPKNPWVTCQFSLPYSDCIAYVRGFHTSFLVDFPFLVPSHLGLAYVLLVGTNPFPDFVVIFPDYAVLTFLSTFSILLLINTGYIRRKRKRSDLVRWQNPFTNRKGQRIKQHDDATKMFDNQTIADKLGTTHLVWLTG